MASIKIILRDKPTKEGLFPVVLRITKDRKSKVISLKYKCLSKDWDSVNNQFKKSYPNYVQCNRVMLKYREAALKIIDDFNIEGVDFTLTQFEERFKGKSARNMSVLEFWEDKIKDLITEGRIGSAKAHVSTKKSFFKFCHNNQIIFREITTALLDKYVVYLRANNNTDGGIGFKMREIRALYNDAIRKGVVDEKYYPFKTFKVVRFKNGNNKRAIKREEVRLIEELDVIKYPHLFEAKMLFLFSYFTRGMNFYDMMKLRWSNVEGNRIVYVRSKTKGNFSVKIIKPVEEILSYLKSLNTTTEYVFPILLKEDLSPLQIDYRKDKMLKKFNKDLKAIAKIVGVDKSLSSYVARHSFATNSKELGVATDIITQSMGHKNSSITIAYLKDFENEVVDDANERLLMDSEMFYGVAL